MNNNLFKRVAGCLFLLLLLGSCKNEEPDLAALDIDKAIELVHGNKAINDTLQRYRQQYGVDFIFCYVITDDNHRRLGLQVMQSANENGPPMLLDHPHKIETVQGIDILFVSSDWDRTKKYEIVIDGKAEELIKKGYLTRTGRPFCFQSQSIDLVFCKNDDSVFRILSSDFLWKEEAKAHDARMPFDERKFYPDCGILPQKKKKASPWRNSKSK